MKNIEKNDLNEWLESIVGMLMTDGCETACLMAMDKNGDVTVSRYNASFEDNLLFLGHLQTIATMEQIAANKGLLKRFMDENDEDEQIDGGNDEVDETGDADD